MNNDFAAPPWEEIQELHPDNPVINVKNIHGLWIPEQYLFAKNLNYSEKLLMSFIKMLDQENHCYASNRYLGELLGTSGKTIANMLTDLKKKKYVEHVHWNGVIRIMKCI